MPSSLPEALEMLAAAAPDVLPLAGGTNLVPDMRGGKCKPGTLVNVAGLHGLQGIQRKDGRVVVGSGVTVVELLTSDVIAEHAPVLRQAAEVFANPLIRNRATVGGNLGHASPAADLAPPLLLLDAEVELTSSGGSRWIPLKDFFVHVCDTACEANELITAVRWSVPEPRTFGRFRKLSLRRSMAISVVSAAAQVTVDEAGYCKEVRLALGAVAPTPVRAHEAEQLLEGKRLHPEVIEAAKPLACRATGCIDDVRSSADYREQVTDVLVRRLLVELAEQIEL
jgi:CO/xanthine dehydrogenase FAD-binding subunit